MGIGDWGLGIGDWGLGPIPNPQSPIPNPQSPLAIIKYFILYNSKNIKIILKLFISKNILNIYTKIKWNIFEINLKLTFTITF